VDSAASVLWCADDISRINPDIEGSPVRFGHNRPSIHMPRWASRINLLVKRVWVERVQDISERDATAEGIGHPLTRDCKTPAFLRLWESIYGPGNPWVWCCEYEREA